MLRHRDLTVYSRNGEDLLRVGTDGWREALKLQDKIDLINQGKEVAQKL